MRKLLLAILLAASPLCAASLDNNTVTVTASRTVSSQPDQVLLYVSLLAAQDAGLDDVLARLKGTGITADLLSSVSPAFGTAIPGGALDPAFSLWSFVVPVSFSKMKDTLASLTQLRSSLGSIQGNPVLTFNAVGTRLSPEAQAAQQCPLPALIADARRQADAMAGASGMKTGAIVAVSDGTSADGTAPIGAIRSGTFSSVSQFLYDPLTSYSAGIIIGTTQPACLITVQFKLTP